MPALLAWLGSVAAKVFTDKVLQWIAMKAIAVFLMTVVLPIVLNNFMYDIIEIVFNFASSQISSGGTLDGAMSFTGLCAWLIVNFKLPETLSVLVSALVLRACLSMIPFVRV